MPQLKYYNPNENNLIIPPADLIRYTCGHEDVVEYRKSGEEVALQLTLAANRYLGDIRDHGPILDFGCGCGRLLGTIKFGEAEVKACDVGSVELPPINSLPRVTYN